MKKNIMQKVVSIIVMIMFCTILALPGEVKANDQFNIYPETQLAMDNAIEENKVNSDYLKEVIKLFNEEIHTNSDDLNELLMDSLNEAIKMNEKTNNELAEAQREADKIANEYKANNPEISNPSTRGVSPVDTAYEYYYLGVQLVKNRGCPQTAAYMMHAAQANPLTYQSYNDSWADKCAYNEELFILIERQFSIEIQLPDKYHGVVSGTFAYTTANSSLDQYTALHNVNYTVTFTKQSNGYEAVYNITDVYDFFWGRYDSIAVGFGNNYCTAMQNLGLIHPFNISIVKRM